MRLYVPELEILLENVGYEKIVTGDLHVRAISADFRLSKYLIDPIYIDSVDVCLVREDKAFPMNMYYTTKPLSDIQLEKKKSELISALIKADDLPFHGVKMDDRLTFSVCYSKEPDDEDKEITVTYVLKEKGWELVDNTADRIKNLHYTTFELPVFQNSDISVTLTGVSYDFENTNYYFSVSNCYDKSVMFIVNGMHFSIYRNGIVKDYVEKEPDLIDKIEANSAKVAILRIGNRPANGMDFDLMTELDENSDMIVASSIRVFYTTEGQDAYAMSKWIVNEMDVYPKEPIMRSDIYKLGSSDTSTNQNARINPSSVLSYEDFIVYAYAFKCLNYHKTEMLRATVRIATPSGEIIEKTVPAAYCASCNKYIILESDYENLKRYGVLLCKQTSYDAFMNNNSSQYKDWKQESDLRLLGYTVNAKDDLSEEQRHIILCSAVNSGLYGSRG